MTLNFEIGARFFHKTHRLDMPYTSAKLYGNPFMQYKVMAQTKKFGRPDGRTDGQFDFNMPPKDSFRGIIKKCECCRLGLNEPIHGL